MNEGEKPTYGACEKVTKLMVSNEPSNFMQQEDSFSNITWRLSRQMIKSIKSTTSKIEQLR